MMKLVAPIAAGVLATAGGVFFGLFSCGGHLWHRQFFWLLLALPMIGAVAVPPTVLRWWPRRLAFIAAVLGLFVVTRGVASAFHPTAPSSWREFAQAVLVGLIDGPC